MLQDTEWSVAIDQSNQNAQIVGEFDHSNASAIPEILATICHPQPDVRVDDGRVTFRPSAFLTSLINARARFAGCGASMTLDPVSAVVQRELAITDTNSLFQVVA